MYIHTSSSYLTYHYSTSPPSYGQSELKYTFSSHRLALALMSAAPPEMTPLFWNRVPSKDTA